MWHGALFAAREELASERSEAEAIEEAMMVQDEGGRMESNGVGLKLVLCD